VCHRRSRRAGTRRRPSHAARGCRAGARPRARQRSTNGSIAAQARHLGEARQYLVQEEAEPDALAAALDADPVHAVVPVAGAHQRQTVLAEPQAVLDGAHAMVVEARRLVGLAGEIVVGVVLATDQATVQERGRSRRAPRCRRWPGRSGRSPAAARDSRPSSGCARRDRRADATSAGRRPRGTGGLAQRSRCSRTRAGSAWTSAMCPATDRGSRRRRRTGSSRCAPRGGRPGSGRAASRWRAGRARGRGLTCTAPSVCVQ
jgi:hypothetical protein